MANSNQEPCISNLVVKCDEAGCGWQSESSIEEADQWHNAPCPKCGKGVIINDDDLSVLHGFAALCSLQKMIDPKGEAETVKVHIETAPLRNASNG